MQPLFSQADAAARAGEGLEVTLVHTWPWAPWVTLLVMLAAGAFVLYLYLHEAGNVPRRARLILAALRLALIALVLTMMYGWMRDQYRTDLPDLIIVLDDSQSMAFVDQYEDARVGQQNRDLLDAMQWDKATRLNLAKCLLLRPDHGWLDQLRGRYNVKVYLLGAAARLQSGSGTSLSDSIQTAQAEQPSSRLGDGVQSILEAQRGRPTAAIMMLTDGVTTEGKSLSEAAHYARRKQVPFFIVGVGDERPPRDVRLSDLLVDQVVFLGDLVNFDFKLTGTGFGSESLTVRLMRKGSQQVLAQQQLDVPGDGTAHSVRLSYRPEEEGEFEFAVSVAAVKNETNLSNNQIQQTVSVRDETIRVLYVQEYPSAEFRFLKPLLERGVLIGGKGKVIDLTTVLQEADPQYVELDETAARVFPVSRDELFSYDVVIFGDVNPAYLSRPVLENIAAFVTQRGGGIMFLAGPRHTPLAYRDTPLENLFPIDVGTTRLPDESRLTIDQFPVNLTRLGLISPQTQLESSPASTLQAWNELPPIRWLLRVSDMHPAAHVLVETTATAPDLPQPVVVMQLMGAGRVVFHATDETFLWSRVRGQDLYYERYWLQTIRYLSRAKLLGANRTVEVVQDRGQYYRGESVPLQVRFYDERMAPVADDGVVMMLEREGGRRQRIRLARDTIRRGVFEGTLASLPEGSYRTWMVFPALEGEPPAWSFQVIPPPGEQARLMMDAVELKLAAETSEGRFYSLASASRVPRDLPLGQHVRIESLPPTPVWNSPWLAGLFVVLLVVEWLGRKRVGWL